MDSLRQYVVGIMKAAHTIDIQVISFEENNVIMAVIDKV
jgi:hypothetical protein